MKKKLNFKFFKTSGDKFYDKNLSEIGNKGLYTKEIDEAQLNGKLDIAIHSLKDLPANLPKDLVLAATLKREDCREIILTKNNENFKQMATNTVIGTSSIRRKMQIKKLRPDIKIKNIRGNIGTRINKLNAGKFDAIILAHAGIKRLGITENFEIINPETIVPAVGQGIIAIMVKNDNKDILEIVKKINHMKTFFESECERLYMSALDGSCETPIGANVNLKIINGLKKINLIYMASSLDGKRFVKGEKKINFDSYRKEICDLAKKIKKNIGL